MIPFLILTAVVVALSWAAWAARRRAARLTGLDQRGLQIRREGDDTLVIPPTGDWTITMTRSFAAQMSPPSSHIVVSTWRSADPRIAGAALLVGPGPTPGLRGLTVALMESATPAMTHWLGIDRISGGAPTLRAERGGRPATGIRDRGLPALGKAH